MNCPVSSCTWSGTRPDIHLRAKHKLSRAEACQQAKLTKPTESDGQRPPRKTETPESLSEQFADWRCSIEEGHFSYLNVATTPVKKKTVKFQIANQNESFALPKLSLLRYFAARSQTQGGILDRLKTDIGCCWGTIKNYVVCLGHFVRFLCQTPDLLVGWGTPDVISALDSTQKSVLTSVTRCVSEEEQYRKFGYLGRVIPAELLVAYLYSNLVKEIFERLGEAHEGTVRQSTSRFIFLSVT